MFFKEKRQKQLCFLMIQEVFNGLESSVLYDKSDWIYRKYGLMMKQYGFTFL